MAHGHAFAGWKTLTSGLLGTLAASVAVLAQAGGEVGLSSPATALELRRLMHTHRIDAVAVEDASEPGRFVAALHSANQLLVVTARCESAEYLRHRVAAKQARDLYGDLHGCAIGSTKFFVQDMGGDGLRLAPPPGGVPDLVYEFGSRQIMLDGDWRRHELTRQAYQAFARQLDARYHRLLTLLITSLTPG